MMIYVNLVQCKEWFTQKFVCLKTQNAEHEWNFKNGNYRDAFFKCWPTFNLSAEFLEWSIMSSTCRKTMEKQQWNAKTCSV